MLKEMESAASKLANTRAGWVTRRDAAELLGQSAEYAVRKLLQRRQESDVDVKAAVERALGRVRAASDGVPPKAGYTLEELAQACAKEGQRTVRAEGDGYVVEVEVRSGRRQRVSLRTVDKGRGPLVSLTTECGACTPEALRWALRANADLTFGALALDKEGDEERLVLRAAYLAGEATPAEVKAAVKELAFYGDWIEQKLMGSEDRR